jgi:hypothetical protein
VTSMSMWWTSTAANNLLVTAESYPPVAVAGPGLAHLLQRLE